jgi:hypothetical protein
MLLGAERVCVMPDASLEFHAAYDTAGNISREGNDLMTSFLPARLAALLHRTKALDSIGVFRTASGDQLSRFYGIPSCEPEKLAHRSGSASAKIAAPAKDRKDTQQQG